MGKIKHHDLLHSLVDNLTLSELNTLLLEVFRQKADKIKPSTLFARYLNNRFVEPPLLDPLELHKTRLQILELAHRQGFIPVELSPLAPLGCCSAMAPVDQNNIVTALRGTEAVSDPTNVLTLEAASRRRKNPDKEMHLCCIHRAVRAQSFDNPNFSAHFELYCMVSADRDRGNLSFEKTMLKRHLQFYLALLDKLTPKSELSIVLIPFTNGINKDLFFTIAEYIIKSITEYPVSIKETEEKLCYYQGLRFNILIHKSGEEHMIIDGGFTDWTQQLLNNKKERLLTSGLGVEYLMKII